jgi:hypothetical protein
LNPLTASKMKISVTDVNSDLTMNSSQKTSNLEPIWLESDQEPNTILIEYFLRMRHKQTYYSGVMISGSWGVARIQFWTDRDTWANLEIESTSNRKLEGP